MKKRIQYLEGLRVFSMFCVVLIHVCMTAITDFPDYSFGHPAGVVFYCIRNFCHFAVPVFFMITGVLFLNPEKELPIDKLIKKYLVKYVAVLVLFGWGFALIEEVFKYHNFRATYLFNSFRNMVEGNSWEHMWYLYDLIGIMLIMPVLRAMAKGLSTREMRYVMVVMLIFLSVIPLFTKITNIEIGIVFPFNNVYVMYVLLGWELSQNRIKCPQWLCWIVIVMSLGVCLLDAELYIMRDVNYGLAGYSSPVIMALSISVFTLFKENISQNENRISERVIPFISNLSFSVYLVHMFWINLLYKAVKFNPLKGLFPIRMLCIWAVVSALSIVTAFIMKKIPLLKKIV